ncbi:aldose epimerase family protein [Neobacillus sp. SM06]|uniref:aldose epimerase family protein n=1 Tax=Neobacillus sp. SM06 TaxID=3422492 RepID=UPI003D26F93A
MEIAQTLYGMADTKEIIEYTLKNDNGIEISCINLGCIITKVIMPDRNGLSENIVLGFESLEEYLENPPYFGAVIGRVAGRIKGAQFELEGTSYQLKKNDGNNHLHGGPNGFHKAMWDATTFETKDEVRIRFSYISADGEEGYPGNATIQVTYTLNNQNQFAIQYEANTDQTTPINLTNHSYFNLSGDLKRDVLNHVLQMESNQFLELNEELLPTGKFVDVADTVFDFRNGRKIKDGAESMAPQNVLAGGGYDHPFLLDGKIVLVDEESGRKLLIETDAPSVVLYTGNQLSDDLKINGGSARRHLGLCLETQGLPDAIHHPEFPSIVLEKGQTYTSKTTYTFKWE